MLLSEIQIIADSFEKLIQSNVLYANIVQKLTLHFMCDEVHTMRISLIPSPALNFEQFYDLDPEKEWDVKRWYREYHYYLYAQSMDYLLAPLFSVDEQTLIYAFFAELPYYYALIPTILSRVGRRLATRRLS